MQQLKINNTAFDNIVISPIGLQSLLGFLLTGATGETAQEIHKILPSLPDAYLDIFQDVTNQLQSSEHYTLNNTNEILYCKNLTLQNEFKRNAKDVFGVHLLPVEDECENNFLTASSSLKFMGLWSKRFEKRSIYKSPFYSNDGETIKIETMHSTGDYYYYEDKILKAEFVEIPFKHNEVFLNIVLPNEGNNLDKLEERLSEVIGEKNYKATYMKLALPKFTIRNKVDFGEILMEVCNLKNNCDSLFVLIVY